MGRTQNLARLGHGMVGKHGQSSHHPQAVEYGKALRSMTWCNGQSR